ncbi:DUF2804 domain-containing protein [Alkalihalobacillus pseudalcaliphilus]|uniref:DUF2804 domain-containing protein n=1 Tax=Alkalihalobacillus pseudalcaliphilus TaxID=79884 RepID=UPI00069F648B|nr:DUF2804 domain-containing protein [Alkalihalobacillus pseudalcaliphilus]
MHAHEIRYPVKLCLDNGDLNPESIGWARQPLIDCNLSGHFGRKKKWNYWCLTSPDFLFSVTISHLDYAAVMFIYVLDLNTLKFFEKTELFPLGRELDMPDQVNESVTFHGKHMNIEFLEASTHTRIHVQIHHFSQKNEVLRADFILDRSDEPESLNVVIPWSKKRFQFTSKQPALPASGKVQWGKKEYLFQPDSAYGCLDFGRGIWKYSSTWNWGAASGKSAAGHVVGLNFGGQWTVGTGQNENGLIIDGKLHKIHEELQWTYDQNQWMKPWQIKTVQSTRVDLSFTPIYEREASTNVVIVQSSVHQMIGYYNGRVVDDEGVVHWIDSMLGWAEDHQAKW